MIEHTPGPWKPYEDGPLTIVTAEGDTIAGVYDGTLPWNKTNVSLPGEANARLIAAAPDLLEACEVALETINILDVLVDGGKEGRREVKRQLRAAIRKATAND